MGKKIRLEFEYNRVTLEVLKKKTSEWFFGTPKITIVTRITEQDVSENSLKIIECTEIIHED